MKANERRPGPSMPEKKGLAPDDAITLSEAIYLYFTPQCGTARPAYGWLRLSGEQLNVYRKAQMAIHFGRLHGVTYLQGCKNVVINGVMSFASSDSPSAERDPYLVEEVSAFLAWMEGKGYSTPDHLLSLRAAAPESCTDETAPAPTAASIVLCVAEDSKGMTLTANGKEIRFRASKGEPTKEMQIVRVLIAKHPQGATAAELFDAGWPEEPRDKEHVNALALRLISAMRTLRDKAIECGLPENIFPVVSKKSIYDGMRFALTCRDVEGAEELRRLDDWQCRALPVNNEILADGEEES